MSSFQRRFQKRQQRTQRRAMEVLTIPLNGTSGHSEHDDCPICRMLAEQDPPEHLEGAGTIHQVDAESAEQILALMQELNMQYPSN